MRRERLDRAKAEHRAERKTEIGGVQILHHRRRQAQREPLPAGFGRRGDRAPSAFDERAIGLAKPRGHGHHAVAPLRADRITDPVERCELALGKGRRAFEHGVDHIGLAAELADPDNMVEDQALVANRAGEAHISRVP